MLKLQEDYTTFTATFEDFILLVFTIIDDLYQQSEMWTLQKCLIPKSSLWVSAANCLG